MFSCENTDKENNNAIAKSKVFLIDLLNIKNTRKDKKKDNKSTRQQDNKFFLVMELM